MYDDNAGNVYCKYLEDIIARQDDIITELKETLKYKLDLQNDIIEELNETVEYYVELNANLDEDNDTLIKSGREKSLLISKLLKDNEELETTILAAQVQAAESEFRADEEKRARLMLKMRL